jgi:ParB-like chromosome segregation protein Spo0J
MISPFATGNETCDKEVPVSELNIDKLELRDLVRVGPSGTWCVVTRRGRDPQGPNRDNYSETACADRVYATTADRDIIHQAPLLAPGRKGSALRSVRCPIRTSNGLTLEEAHLCTSCAFAINPREDRSTGLGDELPVESTPCLPEWETRMGMLPAGYAHHYIPPDVELCRCATLSRADMMRGYSESTETMVLPFQICLDPGDRDIRHAAYPVHVREKDPMTAAQNIITARTVPLSSLWLEAPFWTNPRQFTGLDDKEIAELGADIKAKGLMDPPKVQRIKVNGEIHDLVIDGQRRVLAARETLPKNAPIPVIDIDEDPIELTAEVADQLLDKALTSLRHEGLSSFELSAVAEGMQRRGRTLDVIGVGIGKSKSWVSRMLKARATATPRLMLQWRKGEITDEQFKELAEVVDPDKQIEATKEVVDARKAGDKSEARVRSKEVKEVARAEVKVANGANKPKSAVVSGEQHELFTSEAEAQAADKPEVKRPVGPKPPSKLAIEEMLLMAAKRPPTSDYVKGHMDGVRYSQGVIEPDKFAKAWVQYVSRIEGRPRPAKKAKPAKKPGKARKAKPAKTSTGRRKR